MPPRPVALRWVALGLSAANLVGVGLAAGAGEGPHAAIHVALAVVLGLWSERLRRRAEAPSADALPAEGERVAALEADMADVQRSLAEAHERLDFAERLLATQRDRETVRLDPPGGAR